MEIINNIVNQYGWTAKEENNSINLYNRKGVHACIVKQKGKKYTITDTLGNKLLSGNKSVSGGIEIVLTGFYFCTKL